MTKTTAAKVAKAITAHLIDELLAQVGSIDRYTGPLGERDTDRVEQELRDMCDRLRTRCEYRTPDEIIRDRR